MAGSLLLVAASGAVWMTPEDGSTPSDHDFSGRHPATDRLTTAAEGLVVGHARLSSLSSRDGYF